MLQIRSNIFETNSSSTHSLVILRKEDWEEVKNGNLFIDVLDAEKNSKFPRLVTENFLLASAREEYLEEERRGGKDCHTSFRDGHYVSWEECLENCKGDYGGYDLNMFGFAGETFINPKSSVWHNCTEEDLGNGTVKVEIDHFYG
jgi:hypothetical protein